MAKHQKTRRDALREIIGTMAAAAALTSQDVEELLAQVKQAPDVAKLGTVRTSDNTVKALKIMLAPKAQAARVFESEFGRKPALSPSVDAKTGKSVCPAYLGSGGACADLGCSLVVCNGLSLGGKPELGANVAKTQESRGNASSGDCAKGYSSVSGSTCSLYVPPTVGFLVERSQWLREKQNDPYIKALMREFNVDKAEALEAELTKILNERRLGR